MTGGMLGNDITDMIVRCRAEARPLSKDAREGYKKGVEDALSIVMAVATVMQRDLGPISEFHQQMYIAHRKMLDATAEMTRDTLLGGN